MGILVALALAAKYAGEASAVIKFLTDLHAAGETVLKDTHLEHIQAIAPNIASAFTIEGQVRSFLTGKPGT
jgi:cytochrome c551/c552